MLQKFGNYLLKKDTHASAAALIFSTLGFFGLPTGFLALIILGLVALIKGPRSGLVVLAWAALPPLCLLYLHQWALLDAISLLRCILVLALALVFRARASWRLILELEVLLGVLVVLGFHLSIRDLSQWWIKLLSAYFEKIELNQQLNLSAEQLQHFIQQVVPYATGLVVVGALLGIFVLLILARWWQKSLVFSGSSFSPEFAAIRMNLWDTGVIGAAVVAWFFTQSSLLQDCLPVFIFPFVIAGLSVLHYGAHRKKPETVLGGKILNKILTVVLLIAYLGLVFVPWLVGGVLALVGIVDSGFNIRKSVFDRKRARA